MATQFVDIIGEGFVLGIPGTYANCRIFYDDVTFAVLHVGPLYSIWNGLGGSSNDGAIAPPNVPYFNVRSYGALGDGVNDDTAAIAAARTAARGGAGGIIYYPAGTYISGNQDISNDAGIYHRGSGKQATTIKLKNGANTDLFSAQTSSINLAANGLSGPNGTLYNFGFSDMTLDGNKANQSSGPSYPLRIYGYAMTLSDINVRNGYSGNILKDFHGDGNYPASYSELAAFDFWQNVMCYRSGGIGIEFGGPNDSKWNNLFGFLDVSHNLHTGPNAAGLTACNMHLWSPGNWYNPTSDVVASDTFHRANQSGWGTSTSGDAWSNQTSVYAISSNVGTSHDAGGNHSLLGTTTLTDVDITATINQEDDGNFMAILWRHVDANNTYILGRFGGVLYFSKYVAGVKTDLVTPDVSSIPVTNDASYRVQMIGTAINVKYWDAANSEPYTWLISTTDSSLSSAGRFGLNTYSPTLCQVKSMTVAHPHTYTNAVPFLSEAYNTLCTNCTAESSDTVQIVALASDFNWIGGAVYDAFPGYSSGIKIGQQAGETPFAGQLAQSGGVTTHVPVGNARIDTVIRNCVGPNGALWLDADGGGSDFRVTFFQNHGQFYSGTLASSSHASFLPGTTKPTSDGTPYTSAYEQPTAPIAIQSGAILRSGSGVPASTLGNNGDFYFRTDTPGTSNQRLYVKSSGSWVGVV